MKNSCQQKDQSPGLSAYEAKSRSVAVFDEISITPEKDFPVLN